MLDVGNRVAGFEIEAYVARGGMAVVYRAREVGLGGRVVALKVIAPELASDETFRRRFTQESHLAASIDHPNIIPIYAAGEADGQLYLVMRYVDGETLGAVFKDEGPLDPAEVLAIFAQVAGALDAAHAHELVHRDVKPKNILLVGNAELTRRHVYLSDFGLTKRVSGDTSVTTAGQFLGTIRYVAPEQISNAPISHRADIYSLACVIFEALTGEPPFVSNDEAATLWSHMSQDPPAVSQRRPGLPIAVDDVLRRALAKDPAQRQPTCQALVAELRAALLPAPSSPGAVPVSGATPADPPGSRAETVVLSPPSSAGAAIGQRGRHHSAAVGRAAPAESRTGHRAGPGPRPRAAATHCRSSSSGCCSSALWPGSCWPWSRPDVWWPDRRCRTHRRRHRQSLGRRRRTRACRSRRNRWPTTRWSGGTRTAGGGPSPPWRSIVMTAGSCSPAGRTGASS